MRYVKPLFLLAFATILALGCAELFVRYAVFSSAERATGAAMLWRSHQNIYSSSEGDGNGGCSLSDSLMPNPFFGFTHNLSLPCHPRFVSNVGLIDSHDFPLKRDPEAFSVVLVGGSVASQMAVGPSNAPSWLELSLNKKFISPNGKPFRISSGAMGAWHYPSQITFLTLYGDSMDAVVAIDGYNEVEKARFNMPIYAPDALAVFSAMRSLRFPISTMAIVFTGGIRRLALSNRVSAKSFLLYGLFQSAANFALQYQGAIEGEHYRGISSFFSFPSEWKEEEKAKANQKKYFNYIKLLASTAGALELRYAHFVQPNRLIDKTLTPEEKQYFQYSSPELYRKMIVGASEALAAKGLNTFSLTSVFKNETGTIYGDNIHCAYDKDGRNRGYEIMADAMAEKIAKAWHLKRKSI